MRYNPDFETALSGIAGRLRAADIARYHRQLVRQQRSVNHPLNARLFIEQLLLSYAALLRGGILAGVMLVDSHCHIDFPELADQLDSVFELMRENQVERALCVSVTLEDFPRVRKLAETYPHICMPRSACIPITKAWPVTVEELVALADHPRVVAIGETGLDYYRLKGDLEWQRERFRTHIRAARECGKPLIIHTREAAEDTLRIMREEGAGRRAG